MEGMPVADIKGYLTVVQAARVLRRHERIIRRYIEKGYLKAERIGNAYLIEKSQVENFVYPRPGNPRMGKERS